MEPVTALIPTWNHKRLLERTIASLERQTRKPAEVLVVDNGSTDGAAESAEAMGARVLRLPRNLGFAAAVNQGLAVVTTPWVAVVNNDVDLRPDWLERLCDAATRANAWFATGKILNASQPALLDGCFDLASRSGCAWRAGAGRADAEVWNQPRTIAITSMTAALFRKALFARVGELDETFGSYLEDVDFGIRCALEGCFGVYEPLAVATHEGSATLGAWSPAMVRLISRNQVLLTAKHRCGSLWPVLAGQLLWGALAVRHGAALAWLAGKHDAFQISWRRLARSNQPQRVLEILVENERLILQLQKHTGWDLFWKLYLTLT